MDLIRRVLAYHVFTLSSIPSTTEKGRKEVGRGERGRETREERKREYICNSVISRR